MLPAKPGIRPVSPQSGTVGSCDQRSVSSRSARRQFARVRSFFQDRSDVVKSRSRRREDTRPIMSTWKNSGEDDED